MVDGLGAFPFFSLYLHYGKKAGTTPGKTFGENAPAETDKKQTAMFEPGNKVGVQFQPGESGNPNGRPVGAKSLGVLINKILDGETELVLEDDLNTTDSPQKITLTRREKIWLKIIMDAEDNKDPLMRLRAALALADRTDGKPGQNIDLTSGGDKMQNPLTTLPVEEQAEILRKLIKANDGE